MERHVLYERERKNTPLAEIVDEMRSAISLTPAETSTGNGSENRTIAFALAFEYSRPDQPQAVAQDLMDRVLQLDARGNSEQAAHTVQFLRDQGAGLAVNIRYAVRRGSRECCGTGCTPS